MGDRTMSWSVFLATLGFIAALGIAFDVLSRRSRDGIWLGFRSMAESLEAFKPRRPLQKSSQRIYVLCTRHFAGTRFGPHHILVVLSYSYLAWMASIIVFGFPATLGVPALLLIVAALLSPILYLLCFPLFMRPPALGFVSDRGNLFIIVVGTAAIVFLGPLVFSSHPNPYHVVVYLPFVTLLAVVCATASVMATLYCCRKVSQTSRTSLLRPAGWLAVDLGFATCLYITLAGFAISHLPPLDGAVATFFLLFGFAPSLVLLLLFGGLLLGPVWRSLGLHVVDAAADPEDEKKVQPGKTLAVVLAVILSIGKLMAEITGTT